MRFLDLHAFSIRVSARDVLSPSFELLECGARIARDRHITHTRLSRSTSVSLVRETERERESFGDRVAQCTNPSRSRAVAAMVLWEITLATAYVLGLPRTYRLALRLQRRLISPKYPKLKDFVYRRTRSVFTVALNVHKEVQRRDISVGRNIGNRILRFLDRLRPQANIRGTEPPKLEASKKSVRTNKPKSDAKQDNPHNKSDHQNPPYTAYLGGQFGSSLRGRFSNSFGRLTPKTRAPSIPVIAMGLWWQPIRKSMTVALSRDASPAQIWRSDFARLPTAPLSESGFARGLIREDIAALIRSPH